MSPSAAPAQPLVHAPGPAPGAVHDHPHHHPHDHGHGHGPAQPSTAARGGLPSLLMASVGMRLLGVAGLLLLLWAAVAWALGEPA